MEMIRCQVCGTQSPESSQYCDECGNALQKYEAPNVAETNVNQIPEEQDKEVPVFQSASVTSVGVPPVAENQEEKQEEAKEDVSSQLESSLVNTSEAGAKPVAAKLIIERGSGTGTEFSISSAESYIGRWDADNGIFPDVDLDAHDPEAKVSRKHARIIFRNGQYMLEDLGSTNGTFVNRGRRLIPGTPHPINDEDEIIVGKTFLRFRMR